MLGQQCDNNFRPENVPCNHPVGDNTKRRDVMIPPHNIDEVLILQQQQQSSGHLSFATRYNSREKRNNNSSNEFDNVTDRNNNNHDTPIDKKCTRKIEKKKEDGYARIAETTSKHKAECSNDSYSWSTAAIEKEEKDNQQSTDKTRYKYPVSHPSSKKFENRKFKYMFFIYTCLSPKEYLDNYMSTIFRCYHENEVNNIEFFDELVEIEKDIDTFGNVDQLVHKVNRDTNPLFDNKGKIKIKLNI